MVPQLLFDISHVDLTKVQHDVALIERVNPHRGHMRMLDGIHWMSEDCAKAVAYKDIRHDEFWVDGHIPGRPIFPGVLMIEGAAQLASYQTVYPHIHKNIKIFLGFAACDKVKFRGQVVPGDRLIFLGIEVERRPRRCICQVQALVRGSMVFEARITGMPI